MLMIDASKDRILIFISVTDKPMDILTKSVGLSFFGEQKQRWRRTYVMYLALLANLPENLITFFACEGIPAFLRHHCIYET